MFLQYIGASVKKITISFVLVFAAGASSAQTTYSGLSAINKIILNTPGISAVSVAGFTNISSAAAEVATTASGLRIPVTTTAATAVAGSRLAGLAAGAMKGATGIGIATILLPMIWDALELKVCPPPDFVCKRVINNTVDKFKNNATGTQIFDDAATACAASEAAKPVMPLNTYKVVAVGNSCLTSPGNYTASINSFVTVCPNNSAPDTTKPVGQQCGANVGTMPANQSDIESRLSSAATGSAANQKVLYDQVLANPSLFTAAPMIRPADAVTVTAPPVTFPPIVKTEPVTNADNTTSTKTTTTTTTVSPVVQGTTVNNTNLSYPTTTTTTTNIVNNNTNVTTNSTTTQTEKASGPDRPEITVPNAPNAPQSQIQLPTDYNREGTQQAILKSLDGSGVPLASTVDKDSDVNKIAAQNDVTNTVITNITPASVGLFNWFPTIPTAACVNPQVPNPLTGALVPVEICKPVSIFAKFISAVIFALALFGSVRCVQDAIKA